MNSGGGAVQAAMMRGRTNGVRALFTGAALAGAITAALTACTPRLQPLQGVAPVGATLPTLSLPSGSRQLVFDWEFEQESMVARGEGAARLAVPDSVRMDLVLAGGMGAASAILIGDSLRLPASGTMIRDLVPPPPLIWAAFGRLALPALPDTVIRVSGDTLRADVGRPTQWRVTVVGDRLTRLERVADGRVVEWVDRNPDTQIRYESSEHRLAVLHTRGDHPATFDVSIWHF